MLSQVCEKYFNSQTKEYLLSNPKIMDFTKYVLYKTPEIIKKIKSINEIVINDNYPIDDITTFNNIKIIIIHTKNKNLFNSNIVIHKIANFQKIYSLSHIGIDTLCNYMNDNNFVMRYLQKNIPEGIENINILHDFRFRFSLDEFPIYFPLSTKVIRINIIYVKLSIKYCAEICNNLPVNLEKLIICYCDYSKANYYFEKFDLEKELLENIKLPFNCKLVIEKFFY